MRDWVLLALCCAVAVGFWFTSRHRAEQRDRDRQERLYRLGASQTMEDSPERALLRGEFSEALRAGPRWETYERLAPLFLASHDLSDATVLSSAFNSELMARATSERVEFFDSRGRRLLPRLSTLQEPIAAGPQPHWKVRGAATLEAEGEWLLYRDSEQWAVFRLHDGEVHGYIGERAVEVDGDLVAMGTARWRWLEGELRPQAGVTPTPTLTPKARP